MVKDKKRIKIDKGESTSNLYTLNCLITMTCITCFAFMLNMLDIFIVEDFLMYITVTGGILCSLAAGIVVKFLNNKPFTKYILFALMSIFITIIGVAVTYHTVLICAMPVLCAVQYKEKKVVYYTYVLSVISIFIGVMGGYYYGLCDANMLTLTNTVTSRYVDEATGMLLFEKANPNPWGTLPLYYVFPRALVLYAFVPVMKHVADVISNNAVREMELKKLSETDSMTQLYNRNKYNQMIQDYYMNVEHIGIIFWDLNGLKLINDNLGHEYGDFAISAVASSIIENLGKNTMAYRVGGDEFVVVAETVEEAFIREMIRRTYGSIERKNKVSKVNISAAAGFCIGEGKNIEKVIADADAQMYEEKQRQKAAKKEA